MEDVEKVLSHRLFSGIDPQEMLQKMKDANVASTVFEAGEDIYSPHSKEKKLGFVLSGAASVFSADDGNRVLLRILETGDSFGVANLFSCQDRFVSFIVAKKTCRILFLSHSFVSSLLQENHTFRMNYIHFLSDRICFLNDKISCVTAGSPERKLAFFLLAAGEEQGASYSLSIHANSLSEMLNVGRASLYRAFETLETENLIRRNGKQITVLDKNALKKRFG